ncbi:MAG: cation diffusion facilitator family transporter [Acidimicrobiia bacterium]|nr:cation diffusion facilitator family transporter [Acidimicrobiia bacterium]
MAAEVGTKSVVAALLANSGIAAAKFVGFFFTRSSSMLAEAVHSVADAGNQALLLLGVRRATKRPSTEHPFGYGRERYFWSFIVAVVIFTLGAGFAVYEGIEKVRHPHEIKGLWWAVAILGTGIVLESLSFRTAIREARPLRGQKTWWQFIRRSRSPELPVVLLEDFGALAGLVIALVAVVLAHVTGNAVWDGIGTLCIGALLGTIAVLLAIELKSLLIGEGALPEHRQQLLAAASTAPGVRRVIHLRTQHLGPQELLVGVKAEFDAELDMQGLASAVDATEARLRAAVPIAQVIYVEPDLLRGESSK